MFDHRDFWVLAGTTAPVIGVGVAVSFGAFDKRVRDVRGRAGSVEIDQLRTANRWRHLGEATLRGAGLVMLTVLVLAMLSLNAGHDVCPTWVVIILTAASAVSVLATSGFTNAIDEALRRPGPHGSDSSS